MYAKAQGYSRSIRSQLATAEQMIEAAEAFVDAAPKDDERGARLLMTIAQSHTPEDKQLAAYRRVAERYPGLRTSKFALGKVRQVEGVGKPYELQFTDAITGKSVSIGDLKGKVVVVDFWATWCGPCVAEMPNMKKLYAEYKDKGVEFVGISLDNAEDKGGLKALRDYCEKNEIAWPQYYQGAGWDSEHSVSWGINSIPTMFVLDADGKLYSTQARGKLEELLPKLIEKSRG
jgi:thiol-disulfide isomerase/thioredoxin